MTPVLPPARLVLAANKGYQLHRSILFSSSVPATEGPVRDISSRADPLGLAGSTRALSAMCWATGLPYRTVNSALFRALSDRILPHPPGSRARNLSALLCSRSLIGQSSRLSIEQMPVRIRSAAENLPGTPASSFLILARSLRIKASCNGSPSTPLSWLKVERVPISRKGTLNGEKTRAVANVRKRSQH